jgi:hypothetical protein
MNAQELADGHAGQDRREHRQVVAGLCRRVGEDAEARSPR